MELECNESNLSRVFTVLEDDTAQLMKYDVTSRRHLPVKMAIGDAEIPMLVAFLQKFHPDAPIRLKLTGKQVTDAGVALLSGLPNLTYLDLSDTAITDAALTHLGKIPALKTLDLSRTAITGDGFEKLAGLKNLLVLTLLETDITDAALAPLNTFPKLGYLSIDGCRHITNAGIESLSSSTNLECLSSYNTAVNDACISHFRRAVLDRNYTKALEEESVGR